MIDYRLVIILLSGLILLEHQLYYLLVKLMKMSWKAGMVVSVDIGTKLLKIDGGQKD